MDSSSPRQCCACLKWLEQSRFAYGGRQRNAYCHPCKLGYGKAYSDAKRRGDEPSAAGRRWLAEMRARADA
jgi:hypothetical protein